MSSLQDLLRRLRERVAEIEPLAAQGRLDGKNEAVLVDVREADEWETERLPGALHLPKGLLEMRAETLLPDRSAELIVYCAGGNRSLIAADSLQQLGYQRVSSLSGGLKRWKDEGRPLDESQGLGAEERE